MLLYATPTDLGPEWVNEVPADAARLIRYASLLVTRDTRLALYTADEAGMPTETVVREAFRNAVCAQVAAWVGAKIDPAAGPAGQTPVVSAQSAGGDSVTYAAASELSALRVVAVDELCEAAAIILGNAGLLPSAPRLM